MSNLNLAGPGAWELMFTRSLQGDATRWSRRPRLPILDPVELPFLFESRIFLVSAARLGGPATWRFAGNLIYSVEGIRVDDRLVFPDLGPSDTTTGDIARRRISLNLIEIVVFPRYSDRLRLTFEPAPWIPDLSFYLWQYTGPDTEPTEDLINALRAQVTTLDFKVDQLLQR